MKLENIANENNISGIKRFKKGFNTAIATLATAALIAASSPIARAQENNLINQDSVTQTQEYKETKKDGRKHIGTIFRDTDTFTPIKEQIRTAQSTQKNVQTQKVEKNVPSFLGTLYGEYSRFNFDNSKVEETPGLINVLIGYNILNRDPKEEGVWLFPTIRSLTKVNKSEFPWDRRTDISAGLAYQRPPFIIGAEAGYREAFEEGIDEGEFFRVWAGLWKGLKGRPLSDSNNFPLTPEGIIYGEIEHNTVIKNVAGDGRVEGSLTTLSLGPYFKLGPFAAVKLNYDAEEYPWNRYIQPSGGLKLSIGPFNVYVEAGHRESFEDVGLEGNYYGVSTGVWFPLSFPK